MRPVPPEPAVWVVGERYPFAVSTHCGVGDQFPIQFDGSAWHVVTGAANGTSPRAMWQLTDFGTMELVDHDDAFYRSENGPILGLTRMPNRVRSGACQ